jgi:hypothetical protein
MNQIDPNAYVVSILGFYLSLTSLLATFFFVHITNWYLRIVAASVSWDQVKSVSELDKWIDCLIRARAENTPQPFLVFCLFAIFLGTLAYFAWDMREAGGIHAFFSRYLYLPGVIFLAVFVIVSLAYLIWGYLRLKALVNAMSAQILRGRP